MSAFSYFGRGALFITLLFSALIAFASESRAVERGESKLRNDGRLDFVLCDGRTAVSIDIEIADTEPARVRGLMGREISDFSKGMLFVFEREQVLRFWMRDTPTSLDMIFFGQNGKIINIEERTTPMSDKVYSSFAAARYVVEVKGGFSEHFNIGPGSRIDWRKH